MKKFLLKISIYLLVLSALICSVNICYFRLMPDINDPNVPGSVQICNFGTSYGLNAFNYQDFNGRYTCSNFALSEQSLVYDYHILQHYKPRIKKGAAVFIVISCFSLFGHSELEDVNFPNKNKRYYILLPSELIRNYDWLTDIQLNYLPALSVEGLKRIKMALCNEKISPEVFNRTSGDFLERKIAPEKMKSSALANFKLRIAGQLDEHNIRIRKDEEFNALYSMINLCREIGARPILITVPFSRALLDVIREKDPEFFSDFGDAIKEIQSNTGVEYYDYIADERFSNNVEFFRDAAHLNKEGSRPFTDTVFHEVLSIDAD